MRPRLTLPTSLVVTVVAAGGCASAPVATDAATDRGSSVDTALADVLRVDVSDVRDVVDAGARDVVDERVCTQNPFDPEGGRYAVRCLARRGATTPCPEGNVCVAEDCPAQCAGCVSPLFCIPDNSVDAGVACAVSTVCDPGDCNPGCRAVG